MPQTDAISCRDFVRQSTELLERSLDPDRSEALETHRDNCRDCRRYLEQIETLASWSADLRVKQGPSEERVEELMGAIGEVEGERQDSSLDTGVQEGPERAECLLLDGDGPQKFLADSFPGEVQVQILNHLIKGCSTCQSRCRRHVYPGLENYKGTRSEQREASPPNEVRAGYEELLVGLQAEPTLLERASIGVAPRSVEFVLWLIREGRERLARQPAQCQQLAELATRASAGLPRVCRVRAAMFRGHVARKARADFVEADRWFDEAEGELRHMRDNEIILAKLVRMKALARFGQSRYREALAFLDQAEILYLESNDFARIGESALERAAIEMELDGPETAVSTVLRAAPLIDWSDSVRYSMAATQNLAVYYAESGRLSRADLVLELSREQLRLMGEPEVDTLLLDWVEGKILNAGEEYLAAAELLRRTRRRFLELDLASQCAFISLDLATSLLKLRRTGELVDICQPMIAYFLSRGITGEALVTTRLFQSALIEQSLQLMHIQVLGEVLSKEPCV